MSIQTQAVVAEPNALFDLIGIDAARARRLGNQAAAESLGKKSWAEVVDTVAFCHGSAATVKMSDFEVVEAFEAIKQEPWFGPHKEN